MKHFYFDLEMNTVQYLTMDERQHYSQSIKLELAFTFQIPVPQSEKFINLIIETQMNVAKDKIYFKDFNVRLYERAKLNLVSDSKYSNKKSNAGSFINYLIKMNSEQILPFLEKEILGKKIRLKINGDMVDF